MGQPVGLSEADTRAKLIDPAIHARGWSPDSERSWTVTREAIEANNYDLKAVNPHRVLEEDTRTPEELLDEIERQQKIIAEAIAELRRL